MHGNSIYDRNSATDDHGVVSKRQKLDTSNSSNTPCVSNWKCPDRVEALTDYRIRLCNTEAVVVHLRKMTAEVEDIFNERIQTLEMQAIVLRDKIAFLEVRSDMENGTKESSEPEETILAQMSSKSKTRAEMESPYIRVSGRIKHPLFCKCRRISTSANIQIDQSEVQRTLETSVEWEFESILRKVRSKMPLNIRGPGADGVDMPIHDVTPIFENQLSEMTPEAFMHFNGQTDFWPQESGTILRQEREEQRSRPNYQQKSALLQTWSKTQLMDCSLIAPVGDQNLRTLERYRSPSDGAFYDAPEPNEPERSDNICPLKIINYHILVSKPTFFEIDWEELYTRIDLSKFSCKQCSIVKNCKPRIVDHIWIHHYGERFLCFYCSHTSPFMGRYEIGQHMKSVHTRMSS